MSSQLATARTGTVLSLVLDAPAHRNALSFALLGELAAALEQDLDGVTGIVISGSDGAFSAGADFRDLTGTSRDIAFDDAVERVTAAIGASPVPVSAAIEGPCLGAGAHLALACDVRVAGAGSFLQVPPSGWACSTARVPSPGWPVPIPGIRSAACSCWANASTPPPPSRPDWSAPSSRPAPRWSGPLQPSPARHRHTSLPWPAPAGC